MKQSYALCILSLVALAVSVQADMFEKFPGLTSVCTEKYKEKSADCAKCCNDKGLVMVDYWLLKECWCWNGGKSEKHSRTIDEEVERVRDEILKKRRTDSS